MPPPGKSQLNRIARARAFLTNDLWTADFGSQTWPARGLTLLRFTAMVGEGFVRDHLLLRASALTYFTVLSIVPMLAMMSSIVAAVGVSENVVSPILDQFARISPDVADNLRSMLANLKLGGLGALGAVALFVTTILGISNIERSFNHIWGVQQERPLGRRLPDYMAVLFLGTLLMAVGLSMATTIKSQWMIQKLLEYPIFETAYHLGLKQLPTFVLAAAFAFLFWFLPYTSVRPAAAALGGIVTAVGVQGALAVYVGSSVGVARASTLYGSFAALPLFFVWIYFFWAIVLLGAEIAFAYQNLSLYVREVRGERAGPAEREAIGLRIVIEIARAFRDGTSPWTTDELSDTLRVPVRTVRNVLVPLRERRILAVLDASEKEDGVQLGRPAETIQIVDVLAALRGPREQVLGDPQVNGVVETILAELGEGEAKASAGQTIADAVAQLPAATPPG